MDRSEAIARLITTLRAGRRAALKLRLVLLAEKKLPKKCCKKMKDAYKYHEDMDVCLSMIGYGTGNQSYSHR